MLNTKEARAPLKAIDTNSLPACAIALIGVMIYTLPRVECCAQMKVKDYYVQGRRGWVRLHEKGGKEHTVPCYHNLEIFLDGYIAAARTNRGSDSPLFRTTAGRTGSFTESTMCRQDAYWMVQRRAKATDIKTKTDNHTYRTTGITAWMKNGSKPETAQQIANHESPRTTKLCDRWEEEISLDEMERIAI